MTQKPHMDFRFSDPPSRSWIGIACAVLTIHMLLISWASLTNAQKNTNRLSQASRLVVQTISLDPSNLLAVEANPLRPNPIPATRLEPNRITPTPVPAVPLEHKTMSPSRPTQPSSPTATPSNPNENIKTTITPAPKSVSTPSSPSQVKKTPANPPNKSPTPPLQKTGVQHAKPVPKKEIKSPNPTVKKPAVKTPIPKNATEKAAEEKKKVEQETAKKNEIQMAEQAKQEKERQQKLVAAAQERIAKINAGSDKVVQKNTNLTSINAITSLEIDNISIPQGVKGLGQREMTYRDELANRLKLGLQLPEYGDVKVDLTIDRMGKVVKVSIISAESVVNRKYIEKKLPGLAFPAFGSNYETAAEYTFTVTLSNA